MNPRRLLLGAMAVLLVIVPVGGWAQEKYVPKDNEELYGTWTNEQNVTLQKAVDFPGGYECYSGISDSTPYETGTEQIETKWTDPEGNIWYKTFGTVTGGIGKGYRWQDLIKISKSGRVRESENDPIGTMEFSPSKYPTKIDPDSDPYQYNIMYRSAK